MGEYKFKGEVNEQKIFITKRKEFQDRFDAPFYKENFDFSNCRLVELRNTY